MPFIVAEIAQAHDGSLGLLHSYIDALAATGVHAIKFQTHIAIAESSLYEPFRVKFSPKDATRFDYWKRMEFSKEEWIGIKQHCEDKRIEFMSTPFSIAAVELLEEIGVQRYKVGSGDTNNLLLLQRIAATQKPVILSSGMSSWTELESSIGFLQQQGTAVSLMQCTTAYPTPATQWGLSLISEMKSRFKVPVGYSDHSGTPVACLAAAALGADILEFHAVFNKRMFGPDATSSLTIDEIDFLVKGIQQISEGIAPSNLKEDNGSFAALQNMFGKSIAVNKDLKKGTIISLQDLETKKPAGIGLPVNEYKNIIGKPLKNDKSAWEFLTAEDVD